MDLCLTDDQQMFQQTTRKFLAASCPIETVRVWAQEEPGGFRRDWWRQGAELGWTSMLVPEDRGGGSVSGRGLADLALVAEEMGRVVSPGPLVPTNVVAASLARACPSDPHRALIAELVRGEAVAAWGLGAPSSGLEPRGRVVAEPFAAGFVLNGVIHAVEAAGESDAILVTASLDPADGDGLIQCVVSAGAEGLHVDPAGSLDMVRRFSDVHFESVQVVKSAVVGSPGSCARSVDRQVHDAVVLQCAEMVGAATVVFELTVAYAFDRHSFGRPLASYQALKHRFADMKMWLEAASASANAAADAVEDDSPDAPELVSVAKSYIGERMPALAQDCVQIHGGIGLTWDHDLHLYLRRVVLDVTQYGTPVDHRERIASLIGLGAP